MDEEAQANEMLDETERLKRKRDLLAKENEQLRQYLRARHVESASACEQLKSEIEMQIEQFEAHGDAAETGHLETLKAFRSEIEAIQCWNSKIRDKYFSRNAERILLMNNSDHDLVDDQLVLVHDDDCKYANSSRLSDSGAAETIEPVTEDSGDEVTSKRTTRSRVKKSTDDGSDVSRPKRLKSGDHLAEAAKSNHKPKSHAEPSSSTSRSVSPVVTRSKSKTSKSLEPSISTRTTKKVNPKKSAERRRRIRKSK